MYSARKISGSRLVCTEPMMLMHGFLIRMGRASDLRITFNGWPL